MAVETRDLEKFGDLSKYTLLLHQSSLPLVGNLRGGGCIHLYALCVFACVYVHQVPMGPLALSLG